MTLKADYNEKFNAGKRQVFVDNSKTRKERDKMLSNSNKQQPRRAKPEFH